MRLELLFHRDVHHSGLPAPVCVRSGWVGEEKRPFSVRLVARNCGGWVCACLKTNPFFFFSHNQKSLGFRPKDKVGKPVWPPFLGWDTDFAQKPSISRHENHLRLGLFHTGLNSVDSDPIIHRRDRSILIAWISCIFFNVTDADIATQRKGVPTWQPCWHVQCFNQEQRHRNYVITCLCPIRFV